MFARSNYIPSLFEQTPHGFEASDSRSDSSLASLAAIWDEPVTYVKQFSEALNCVNSGYFISYFSQKCLPGEWLSLNNEILWADLGLSPKQWRLIRQQLMQRNLLLNKRTTQSGSIFTLNDVQLERLIEQHSDLSIEGMVSSPISVNKLHIQALANQKVSIKAILMLALIQSEIGHVPMHERGDWSEWIAVPEKFVFESTYLSRREQESALQQLQACGVVQMQKRGVPSTRYCRYSLEKLAYLTSNYLQK